VAEKFQRAPTAADCRGFLPRHMRQRPCMTPARIIADITNGFAPPAKFQIVLQAYLICWCQIKQKSTQFEWFRSKLTATFFRIEIEERTQPG
jgi:hypothetical protein